MDKPRDTVDSMNGISPQQDSLKRNGLWRSHLCALIFSLSLVVLIWGGLFVWNIIYGANPYTNVLGVLLFIAAATLLATLFYRIQTNFLKPLTQLRQWVTQMMEGHHEARLSLDNTKEFTELTRDINLLGETLQNLSEDMQSQVQQQTHHIQQKTRSLEIIYDVAASITPAAPPNMVFKNLSETLLKKSTGSAPTPVANPASVLATMPKEIGDIVSTS